MINRRAFLLSSVAALGVGIASDALARPATNGRATSHRRLKGARAPVEIIEDELGVPHVRAQSHHDAFFGQGYLVARDRLFQIDLQRRRELGRMAEAFGPDFAPSDKAARLFLFRGDIDAELRALPPKVLECAKGYVAGVNARIAELKDNPGELPLEYGMLGISPLPWDVRDFVRIRGWASGDVDDEIRRARLAARNMLDADALMAPLRPAWTLRVPDGLDVAAVSEMDLGLLDAAAGALPFDSIEVMQNDAEDRRVDRFAQGSNAWTISPSRSATGRPILANDPHLGIGRASPRHMVHMTAPGLDVIGAGAPGLPGIMQGHTDRFAFGRTNFHIDQTDLFILRTRPDHPDQYWHKGKWTRFETFEDEVIVNGGKTERVTLRYAKGRPVIAATPESNRAVAFATVSMLPGANMSFAIIAINLAKDWDSLRAAVKIHVSPTNLHYADIDGNTGWQTIGFTPVRPKHDGLMPAPGDGSFDWIGILPVDEMPHVYNPAAGWFASANQMNLPADYPYQKKVISFDWSDPFRYNRIAEVLSDQPRHSLADSVALQHDVQSLPARALLTMLPPHPSPHAAAAVAMLRDWDCNVGADSGAALLYEMVMPELSSRFRAAVVPAAAMDLIPSVNLSEMLRLLNALDPRLGINPRMARDQMLDDALAAGWRKAVEKGGPDASKWRWGDLHRVNITHPLASALPPLGKAFHAISGGRSGGDGTTPMARGFNAKRGYDVSHGASYLMVADVGQWDNSRFLMLPGQSADPRSPHYRDFYDKWLAGDMQPLWFSKAAVDAHAAGRILVTPGGR